MQVTDEASQVVVGDFNGDGKPDLATTYPGSIEGPPGYWVEVHLGNGDGTFQGGVAYGTGSSIGSVAVGDFNGDGKLDLAATHWLDNLVSVLLGNGDGTFQVHVEYLTGTYPFGLAVGDFNGDTKLDLAVTNWSGNSVSLLLGNGNGTFQMHVDYATGNNPGSVEVADFNGDGRADVVLTSGGFVSVLLGNGDGTLQPPVDSSAGNDPAVGAVGDFNGDGKADLIVVDGNSVMVLLGKGDGTFQIDGGYATGNGLGSVAAGEFNGDGRPDLAVTNGGDDSVSVLLGNGDGVFQDPRPYYITGRRPHSLAVGNFNGDGKPDLASANASDDSVSVLLGKGDGTFQSHADYSTGGSPNSVVAGDFNGDGRPDLATANYSDNSVSVLLGKGDGTFQSHIDYATATGPNSVVVGDFNGDGKQDLVVTSSGSSDPASNFVSVLAGNGDGTFQNRVNYARDYDLSSVAMGDFNGDGKQDLAVTGTALAECHGNHCFWSSFVEVLLGNGDGSFQGYARATVNNYPSAVAVGDLNGDGKPDLAVTNNGGSSVSVLLGNGDGTFQPSIDYANGQGYLAPTLADFNLDGAPDLSFITPGSAVSILLNMRGTVAELQSSANPSISGQSVTLTATIHSSLNATGIGTPTGTIKFQDGTSQLGSQTLDGNGVASMAIDALTTGEHDITAVYSGDSNFNPTTSGVLTQVVNVPDFALSTSPSSATLRSGSSAVFTITASSMNGFVDAVSLTCSVSPASTFAPTCAFNPPSITPTASGSATSKLTVTTTGPTASLVGPSIGHVARPLHALWLPISGLALLGVGLSARRSGRKKIILGILLTDLLLVGLGPQIACGGGGGSNSHVTSSGTPPGQYTVTANAVSGSLAHTTKVTLTVQ
jgi:hypothetical protein